MPEGVSENRPLSRRRRRIKLPWLIGTTLALTLMACNSAPGTAPGTSKRSGPPTKLPYSGAKQKPWTSVSTLSSDPSELVSGYLSDQLAAATTMSNGWGPVEPDRSNGDDIRVDGKDVFDGEALSLSGVKFAKGLGVHASSDLVFSMDGTCTQFTASVGVDDSVRAGGKYDAKGLSSVGFQVWADNKQLFDSGTMTEKSATQSIDKPLPPGAQTLRLVVSDGGDGIRYDHADWAGARVECGAPVAPPPAALPESPTETLPVAPTSGKKLIELGWDAPTPNIVRANIATMEERPFDGLVVNLSAGKTIFNKTAYPESAFVRDAADLAATPFRKLRSNFISIWGAREANWSWFNDNDWAATQTNARNFARTAKAGNFKGFFFDPEPYGTNPWSYNRELYPNQSFAEVQRKVRQRGAGFMNAIQGEMPDVQILTLFGMTYIKKQAQDRGNAEAVDWTLLSSFIEGMLDAIGPQARLIDGNEPSYYYYLPNAQEFSGFKGVKDSARDFVSPENRAKYDTQVSTSHAVFAEGLLGLYNAQNANGLLGCHLRDLRERQQILEHHTYQALKSSDEYVWVYDERFDWWNTFGKGVQVLADAENIFNRAKLKVADNQPLGFDVEPFLSEAAKRYARTWGDDPNLGCL